MPEVRERQMLPRRCGASAAHSLVEARDFCSISGPRERTRNGANHPFCEVKLFFCHRYQAFLH